MLRKGDYGFSLDIQNAFLHLPLHRDSARRVRFAHRGRHFQARTMVFGVSIAPRTFAKTLAVAIAVLRESGIICCVYADDILITAPSEPMARLHAQRAIGILIYFGWHLSESKSDKVPSQSFVYLGLHWDTASMTIGIPASKSANIRRILARILRVGSASLRELARVKGVLMAVRDAVALTRRHVQQLRFTVTSACRRGLHWDSQLLVQSDTPLHRELALWLDLLQHSPRSVVMAPPPTITLITDSSDFGWGGVFKNQAGETLASDWQGWTTEERRHHINMKELMTVRRILRRNVDIWSGQSIRLKIDNTTALWLVNSMSGRVSQLAEESGRLWDLVSKHKGWIRAEHIPGDLNMEADALSRISDLHEWSLRRTMVEPLFRALGRPAIDAFSSALNNLLPAFWTRADDAVVARPGPVDLSTTATHRPHVAQTRAGPPQVRTTGHSPADSCAVVAGPPTPSPQDDTVVDHGIDRDNERHTSQLHPLASGGMELMLADPATKINVERYRNSHSKHTWRGYDTCLRALGRSLPPATDIRTIGLQEISDFADAYVSHDRQSTGTGVVT
jgi:reverse transcriptase-like protein